MTAMLLWVACSSVLLASLWMPNASAQVTCSNGALVYQRTPTTSIRLEVRADRIIEVASSEVPTSACLRVCEGTPSCRSFSVDYTTRTCKVYSEIVPQSRLIQRPGSVYFEKICLPDASESRIRAMCGSRMWAVERVRGLAFNTFVARINENVPSREVCIRSCLGETAFECAAATYDEITRSCALSTEDRHTQPLAFTDNSRSSDYYENQCMNNLRDCQFLPQNNIRVVTTDYITVARSENECRDDCSRNAAIICRSYNYDVSQSSCMLSSDDSVSLLGVDLPSQDGLRYAERRCRHSVALPLGFNQLPFATPQALALAGGNAGQFGIVPTANQNFLPNTGRFAFGNTFPQSPSSNVFPQGGTILPPTSATGFSNFAPQGLDANFGRRIPGTSDPRFFGNPYSFSSSSSPFPTNFLPVVDGCTLEKTSGVTVLPDPQGIIPTNTVTRGITTECAVLCRLQGPARCPAFTVDYAANQCVVLNRPAQAAIASSQTPTQSYFEQVCYDTIYRTCQGKTWAFQRYMNTALRGFDDRLLQSVASRQECEQACLKETQFLCLSAEYDASRLECRLSRESRITRSYALQQSPNVDYLENQCTPATSAASCNSARQEGMALLYADAALQQVYTEDECRRICQTFPNFTCVAASFGQTTHECLLSSDVTVFPSPEATLLYSSCLNPVQVSAPVFTSTGTGQQPYGGSAFGNQFPGSGVPSSGFGGGGTSFPTFAVQPQLAFFPNQLPGNFVPLLNTQTSSQNPFLTPTLNAGFNPNQTPQVFGTGTSTFPQQNPALFGTGTAQLIPHQTNFGFPASSSFPQQNLGFPTSSFPQQNPQLFGTGNSVFPTTGPFVSTGPFLTSTGLASSGFPQPGHFSSLNPGGVQQTQFVGSGFPQRGVPVSSSGFQSQFPNGALNSDSDSGSVRNVTSSSVDRRGQRTDQRPSQTVQGNKRRAQLDEVEVMARKPIRDAPRFLRAERNISEPLMYH